MDDVADPLREPYSKRGRRRVEGARDRGGLVDDISEIRAATEVTDGVENLRGLVEILLLRSPWRKISTLSTPIPSS